MSLLVTCPSFCRSEASLTVALWFHSLAVVGSILPLAFGYPSPPVVPTVREWLLLLAIAAFSFVNQICLNRGFQLEVAAKASAVNYTQVCKACRLIYASPLCDVMHCPVMYCIAQCPRNAVCTSCFSFPSACCVDLPGTGSL